MGRTIKLDSYEFNQNYEAILKKLKETYPQGQIKDKDFNLNSKALKIFIKFPEINFLSPIAITKMANKIKQIEKEEKQADEGSVLNEL